MMQQMMTNQMMPTPPDPSQQKGDESDSDVDRQREEVRADKRPLSTSYKFLGARKGGRTRQLNLEALMGAST